MHSTGRSFLLKLCLGDHLLSLPSSKTFLRQKCLTAPSSQVLADFQEACQAFGQTVKGSLVISHLQRYPPGPVRRLGLDKEHPGTCLDRTLPCNLTTPTAIKEAGVIH